MYIDGASSLMQHLLELQGRSEGTHTYILNLNCFSPTQFL